jgi:hypothetical protein
VLKHVATKNWDTWYIHEVEHMELILGRLFVTCTRFHMTHVTLLSRKTPCMWHHTTLGHHVTLVIFLWEMFRTSYLKLLKPELPKWIWIIHPSWHVEADHSPRRFFFKGYVSCFTFKNIEARNSEVNLDHWSQINKSHWFFQQVNITQFSDRNQINFYVSLRGCKFPGH